MSGVSVVIPVRDGERYLGEAIDSALGQVPAPAEVVVVDDGSADSSAAIAAAFGDPVRVVSQPARGIAHAVNRGIAETEGPLVAMIDADDVWLPEKLRLQLEMLDADPALDAVFCHAREFASPDLDPAERATLRVRAEPAPFRAKSTILVRRRLLDRVGPFDPSWRVGDFVDWHARAEEAGMRSLMLDVVLVARRVHDANMSRVLAAAQVDYARIARTAVNRRREARR